METFKTDISLELPKKKVEELTKQEVAQINEKIWEEISIILKMVTNK